MRRGYVVTPSQWAEVFHSETGFIDGVIVLQTTCFREALTAADEGGYLILPCPSALLWVSDSCNGCSPLCRQFPAPKKR